MQQTIRMRALEIAFDALRAEFALIKWKLHPRLEADDLIVFDKKLNAALLATETAVRLDHFVRRNSRIKAHAYRSR